MNLLFKIKQLPKFLGSILRGANKANPKSVPTIKTFGSFKSKYFTMIFTENSPLVPMFYQATIQAFESGAYDRLSLNWQGGPIKPVGAVDLLILTPGQVFLIFGIMCFFMVTAIFAFFLEWCCHFLNKKFGKWTYSKLSNKHTGLNKHTGSQILFPCMQFY